MEQPPTPSIWRQNPFLRYSGKAALLAANTARALCVIIWRELRILIAIAGARLTAKPPAIISTWPGARTLQSARRVAVFCHYDAHGELQPHTEEYLKAIADCGFATVFVSSAPALLDTTRVRAAKFCSLIIHRRNVGYDFGCYRDGIEAAQKYATPTELLVANDSVYGPFLPLSTLLNRCTDDADFWGLTESRQHTHHMQSYFMLFRERALHSRAFSEFWRNYPSPSYKPAVIRCGELALSKQLRRAGIRMRALFSGELLMQTFRRRCELQGLKPTRHQTGPIRDEHILAWISKGVALNPTHHFWRDLLALGFPFIKRELVDRNPEQIVGIDNWRAHLPKSVSEAD